MKLSVKPVPAARILMRTSPGPGSGMVGCSASSRTSGPPKRVIWMCCHDMIAPSYHGSDVIAVEFAFACLLNQRSDVRKCEVPTGSENRLLIGVDRKWIAHGQNDEIDPGCVKTSPSRKFAELFSLSSSPNNGRKHFWFSN